MLASFSCIYWIATQIKPLFHKVKVFRRTQRKQEYYSPQLELFLCISCSRFCSWRQKNNAAYFYHLYFKIYDITAHPEAMFTDTPRFFELTGLTMSGMQDLYHIFLQGFFSNLSPSFLFSGCFLNISGNVSAGAAGEGGTSATLLQWKASLLWSMNKEL